MIVKTHLLIAICILFLGCEHPYALEKGERVWERIELETFEGVNIGQSFRVQLKNDTNEKEYIRVNYYQNLIKNISLEIKEGILVVQDKNPAKWTRNLNDSIIVVINAHRLKKLFINGASQWTTADTLRSSAIEIEVNSVKNQDLNIVTSTLTGKIGNIGRLQLSGFATIFSWTIEGGGQLDARFLRNHDTYLWHYTENNAWVHPERQGFLYLYNSGNALIPKEPSYKLTKKELGKGRVIINP